MGIRDDTERLNLSLDSLVGGRSVWFVPDVRLIPGLVWVVFVLGGSILTMVLYSFMVDPLSGDFTITFEFYREFFSKALYRTVMIDSLVIALKTTLGTLLVGYPLAYYIAVHSDHRNLLLLVVIAPIWINEVIRTFAWMLILNTNGVINYVLVDLLGVLDDPLRLMNTETAVVIGLVHPLLPYMIVPIIASLLRIDFSEIEAARNLGATKLQAFYEVTLPQTVSGIAAGATFVFVLSSGAYLAPVLLGGSGNNMIANFIGLMFSEGQNWNFGAVLAVIYSAVIVVLFVAVGLVGDLELGGATDLEGDQ
ncbi:ABC transporter permease [Halomarina oriensis]|uniref:ABC transporter permease subunit n=1 Tax=Halomarina oriensis TaxID=671145 RepID=A0A6B0GF14_9EURY|nr:ABC transporter permease [Halomarina oriensis]MWG33412.1 ABC transporter permease subunit [Halomarina oriensis]